MFCAMIHDVTAPSVTAMLTICLPHVKWCTKVDAIDHVSPSYPPESNVHSADISFPKYAPMPISAEFNNFPDNILLNSPIDNSYPSFSEFEAHKLNLFGFDVIDDVMDHIDHVMSNEVRDMDEE
ncbi:hypothetical protein TNCV_4623131 [Trichonephila clavipes]|nr:hypothetical protein TNCV_4623131 [Trichonephila clavipes]